MKTYNQDKPLVSIHLPKCGGSSLKIVLKKWFKGNLKFHYFDENTSKLPVRLKLKAPYSFFKKKKYKPYCIHGHFNKYRGFGIDEYYPDVDQFMTFLRDPLEVHVSNYFFVKKKFKVRDGKEHSFDSSLNEYLIDVIENGNSWYLTHFPEGLTEDNYEPFINERFIFVGVIEKYEESLEVLSQVLGKAVHKISRDNVTERDAYDIDEDIIRRFQERFSLDYKIYQMALDYLEECRCTRDKL